MTVPVAAFAPVSRSGVLWGLSGRQLALVTVAIGAPAWELVAAGDLGGALLTALWWTAPITVLAVGSYRGRSFLERVVTRGLFMMRKAAGKTTARVKIAAGTDGARLTIPGAAGDRLQVLDVVAVPYGIGAAFVWDGGKQTATVVLRFTTQAWAMAEEQDKAARANAVGALCNRITELDGVVRVSAHARTYPADPGLLPSPRIDATSKAGEFAAAEHAELVSTSLMGRTLHRDVLVAVTVALKDVHSEVAAAGGGVGGMSAVMAARVQAIVPMLPACGVRVEGSLWMGRADLMGALRLAFDPESAPWLEAQNFRLPEGALVVSVLREQLDHLVTDSAFHRTYWVENPPMTPTPAGFLTGLIAGGQIPHTVTQLWEPIAAWKAEKRLNNAIQSHTSSARAQEWAGRPQSAAHAAEGKDLELRRKEIEAGFTDVAYSMFITMHAANLEELDRGEAWLRAATVGMSVKAMRGQQWASFTTAALPVGLGVRA